MKKAEKLAIIADDFTGAGDAGIHFALGGSRADLILNIASLASVQKEQDAVAITTETRFLSAEDAAKTVSRTIGLCREAGYGSIYKKIDSTMRGNPGSEIEAALAATGQTAAIICPAMPETGRICVRGAIWIHGKPLHLSDIGKDPFHPLATSSIAELLQSQTALGMGTLDLEDIEAGESHLSKRLDALVAEGRRLVIADASEFSHMSTLARLVMSKDLLPVGAGGFARALADEWARGKTGRPETVSLDGPLLAIVGSLTPVSLAQAKRAEQSGLFTVITLKAGGSHDEMRAKCEKILAEAGMQEPNVLLCIKADGDNPPVSPREGERVSALLGATAAEICSITSCRTVFSTGGSTAIAVAEALGIRSVHLITELLPGIVLGKCQKNTNGIDGFISKAGGFGPEDLLIDITSRIKTPCLAERL
ncbi:Uncharacterized conserved protein YgbK, DUF1537 family [Cohaesibacter sp. ES.047]|uniref:four-carbon acid sugar kinase family protein n=1 Tax=Cohaesibacter sp. ES.047 TaxID=1798205 RepID=UPI000BB6D674|nr:four-carbon acid sugar kinase family protein [Cohaesibacter sp. ES.047]SNY92958.1 Uncharacterized conserved protein YgbK, DUF1537 family [Cohaesibacter sp. ES.047]